MLFEDILILLLAIGGIGLVGLPAYRIYQRLMPKKRDTLKEAEDRLKQARIDLEAAEMDRKTNEVYDNLYKEALEDGEGSGEVSENKRRIK